MLKEILTLLKQRDEANKANPEVSKYVTSAEIIKKFPKCNGAGVRSIIHEIRMQGIPILANSKGYYIARNKLEIETFVKHLDGRARSIKEVSHKLKQQFRI